MRGTTRRVPWIATRSSQGAGSAFGGAVPRCRSAEQGAEQLAQIIMWGLMGFDPNDLPQFPNNSVSELTAEFAILTQGSVPRR